jgi:hypothetical protein
MATPSGSAARQSPTISVAALGTAVAALAVSLYAAFAPRPAPGAPQPVPSAPPAQASLAMATCTGAVAESADDPFWKIPLDKCDKAIDAIDVKAGFVSKWSICGGAKSFEVTLDPRAVIVSSDSVHCSNTPSEVSVTFIGPPKN